MKYIYVYVSMLVMCILMACSDDKLVFEMLSGTETIDHYTGTMKFSSDEEIASFCFLTNKDWMINIEDNGTHWCSVSQMSGQAGEITVQVHVDINENYEDRIANLMIIHEGELLNLIQIVQKRKDELSIDTVDFEMDYEGGNIDFVVKSNVAYEIIIPDEYKNWITQQYCDIVDGIPFKFSTYSFYIGNYDENSEQREGKILLLAEKTSLNKVINIEQKGKKYNVQIVNSTAIVETNVPGILSDVISKEIINSVFSYKFNCPLNATDIGFINKELYCRELDLSDASIVSGGFFEINEGPFVSKYETKDNILPTYSFKDNHRIERILLPKTLYGIEFAAFSGCTSLSDVILNDGLIELAGFNDCVKIEHIEIPNTVEKINAAAFSRTSIQNIMIPNSVTCIELNAFNECKNLASIVIPNSVTSLGMFAFCACRNLSSVVLSDNLLEIGARTFDNCNLTSIVLPSKIEKIGEYAFSGCNINSIEFPASLKYIDNAAFGLFEEIHVKSNLPVNCNLWAFGFAEECMLYVPKGSKSIYQTDSFWGQCKNIVEVSL